MAAYSDPTGKNIEFKIQVNIGWVPGYSSNWQNNGKYLVNIGELDTYAEFLERLRKLLGAVAYMADHLYLVDKMSKKEVPKPDPAKTMKDNGIGYNSTKFEFRIDSVTARAAKK